MSAHDFPTDKSHTEWLDQQRAIRRFEAAWADKRKPNIDDYLHAQNGDRESLLCELIHTDLEYRIKAGEPARVEEYLKRYPELGDHDSVVLELVVAEHTLRRRLEPGLTADEYACRFPRWQSRFAEQLPSTPQTNEVAKPTLTCPDCRSCIHVPLSTEHGSIQCPECGTLLQLAPGTATTDVSHEPKKLGKYRLDEVVGRGSFGIVYRAWDTELERTVAVKIPRLGTLALPEEIDRFLREAKSAAQLRHPHIVAVHDVGRVDQTCFLVADFVPGETLAEKLCRSLLPFRQTATLAVQIAEALHYAHKHGVVHRDLKPSNVIIDPSGEPHLLDFGLARREAGDLRVTLAGQVLGTPGYMAPEQARGDSLSLDGRADVYSLGVVLYEMLTGELPFRGNVRMVLRQVLEEEPRPPRRLNDRIPRDLETITLKALAKDATRRYANAWELANDLTRFLNGEPIRARPAGQVERAWRWCKRNRRVAALSGLALGLLICLAIGALVAAFVIAGERQNAVDAAKLADQNATRASQARQEAENQAQIADEHFKLALDGFGALVGGVQDTLTSRPGLMPLQQKLTRTALDGLQKIAAARKSPQATATMSLGHERLGDLFMKLNRHSEAREQYQEAKRLARMLVEHDPHSVPMRRLLANIQESLAGLANTSHHDEAEINREFGQVLEMREALYRENPDNADLARDLAHTYAGLGEFQRMYKGDFPAARAWYEKGLAIREHWARVAPAERGKFRLYQSYDQLAIVCGAMRDVSATKLYLDRAQAEAEAMHQADPRDPAGNRALAVCHERRGLYYTWLNEFPAAVERYRQAVAIREKLVHADPEYAPDKASLAVTWRLLGEAEYCARHYNEARAAYRENLKLGEVQSRQNPGSVLHLSYAILPCERLAQLEERAGHYKEAADWLRKGVEWCEFGEKSLKSNTFLSGWKHGLLEREAILRAAENGVDDPAALRKHPPSIAYGLFALRALKLARNGEDREALAALNETRSLSPNGEKDCLEVTARVYSLCLGAVKQRPNPDAALCKRYTNACIAALRELIRIDQTNAPSYQVVPEPDYGPIRLTEQYQQLAQETLRPSGKK